MESSVPPCVIPEVVGLAVKTHVCVRIVTDSTVLALQVSTCSLTIKNPNKTFSRTLRTWKKNTPKNDVAELGLDETFVSPFRTINV